MSTRTIISRRLFDDAGLKLISLALALGLWSYANRETTEETLVEVAVHVSVPDNMVMVSSPLRSVIVGVRGRRSDLNVLRNRSLEIRESLVDAGPGEHIVILEGSAIEGIPPRTHITSIRPSTIAVVLEEQVKRDVDVLPTTVGRLPRGYRVVDLQVEPRRVSVVGAQSRLDEITAVPTAPVRLTGIQADFEFDVGLELSGMGVWVEGDTDPSATIRGIVEEVPVERVVPDVVVEISDNATFAVRPAQLSIRVRGSKDVVDRLTSDDVELRLEGPSSMMQVGAMVKRGGSSRRPRLVFYGPDGVSLVQTDPEQVEIVKP